LKHAVLIAVLALATGAGVHAQETPSDTAHAATGHATTGHATTGQAEADQNAESAEVVCRTERVTGARSRSNRICMTRAEWAELSRSTQKGISDFTRNARTRACTDPGGVC